MVRYSGFKGDEEAMARCKMKEVIEWLSVETCVAVAKDLYAAVQVEDVGFTALRLLELATKRVQDDGHYCIHAVQLDSEHGDMTRTLVIERRGND